MTYEIVDLPHERISHFSEEFTSVEPEELDFLYQECWKSYQEIDDEYSEEGDEYLAKIIAIEERRGYTRGAVNNIRYGAKRRR